MSNAIQYLGMNIERLCDENIVPDLSQRVLKSAKNRVLPSFFIAGVEKCGTSSLFHYLLQHRSIIPPQRKDTYFFSNNNRYNKGIEFYRAFFAHKYYKKLAELRRGNKTITLDSTAIYFDYPQVPQRIHSMFPNTKVILMLREPVSRTYSNYNMAVKFGFETLPFEKAIEMEEERVKWFENSVYNKGHNFAFQRVIYKSRSEYINYLPNWKNVFGDNLYIEFAENLSAKPQETFNGVLDFLGLKHQTVNFEKLNEGSYKSKMDEGTKQKLTEHFRPLNEKLASYLGRELPWKQ
ncbi:MAG TPA: sulfotransferase [Flavobacteriales bacterium]|nr:sulfotransferase [Flavobacteriales bacterium]